MKIERIEAAVYTAPYPTPITNGKYTYKGTESVLAFVTTDTDMLGIGWTHGGRIVYDAVMDMAERLIGENPFRVERIWESLYLPKIYGQKGIALRALSCLDIALWDLMGQRAGAPLWTLIGGYRDSIPAYVAAGYYGNGKDLSALQQEMRHCLSHGVKAVKMKIGALSVQEDVERIDAARDALGSGISLLVDANNAYDRMTALKMGRALEKRDIFWFEEPLSPDDLEGCAELRRRIDVPIAVGENEYTRFGFQALIHAGAAEIFNADAMILGGITEWRRVAAIAQANHIRLAPHGDQGLHVPLLCGAPGGLIAEYLDPATNPLRQAMFTHAEHPRTDGTIAPSEAHGHGLAFNLPAMEPFKVLDSRWKGGEGAANVRIPEKS